MCFLIRQKSTHTSHDTYINFHNITPFTVINYFLKYGENVRKTSSNINAMLRQTAKKDLPCKYSLGQI